MGVVNTPKQQSEKPSTSHDEPKMLFCMALMDINQPCDAVQLASHSMTRAYSPEVFRLQLARSTIAVLSAVIG